MSEKSLVSLALSLTLMLLALPISSPILFGLAAVSAIVSLASLKVASRLLLIGFWSWVNGILLLIFFWPSGGTGSDLIVGLPWPAFWMLFGIWIFPVFIWPLGYLRGVKRNRRP